MRASIHIDLGNVDFQSFRRAYRPIAVERVVRTSATRSMVPPIRAEMRKQGSVVTGRLSRSTAARFKSVSNDSSTTAVGTFKEYGLAVEEGTAKYTPNWGRLRAWVKRKIRPADVDSTTFAIFRKIQQEGADEHPHVLPAATASFPAFATEFGRRLTRHLKL